MRSRQRSRLSSSPQPLSGPTRARVSRQPSRRNVAIALEATAKAAVHLVLIAVGTSAIVRLIPYYRSVQAKLESVEIQVQQTQERVDSLQLDFDRSFDPDRATQVMAEQSHRIDPQRRSVVWKKGNPQP
ncbi:hypothetical protein [Roseofilum casamattae]|uniref:Cell division protein FtsL n=1 Tax=Roseofilum casamattae BLCC-M143 TaxID=3022442 RepID=A0ABT7BRP5_9CYAN|nr:hypothetical protein [Roseofilum casamattae]MDJ1181857.1 hypothetical protein [Roseofilum casamattae BLCC-M143]